MLTVSDLHTGAGSFRLGPVDLTVSPGRALIVLGPSGAGKSMLLDTIAGFRTPRSGRVHLDGHDLTGLPPDRRRIGVVFQDAALFTHLSVGDNVGFAPALRRRRRDPEIGELLDRFGIAHLAHRAPRSLSGGERQRVALARALAARPAALLLDEPLSALDQPVREELREVLRTTLQDLAVPAIHVTHDRDEALRLADDLAILDAGTLCQTGPADELTRRPTHAVTARLLGWTALGPARHDSAGLRVGELPIDSAVLGDGTKRGTVYYRPEEVLLDSPDRRSTPALRARARVLEVVRTVPLARVLLGTTPPLTALVLHRDLYGLGGDVEVAVPRDALRILEPAPRSP
ncbi:ABC transporter ATP-binding protein [Amycolatopsis sp. NPDC004368]